MPLNSRILAPTSNYSSILVTMQSAGKRKLAATTKGRQVKDQPVATSNTCKKRKRRTSSVTSVDSCLPRRIYFVKQIQADRKTFRVPFVQVLQTSDQKGLKSKKRNQKYDDIETTISIGDTVLVCSDQEDFPFIARIEDIAVKPHKVSTNKKEENWQHGRNCSIWLSLRWFYQPSEIVVPPDIQLENDDVLFSNHIDKNNVECYLDKCCVIFSSNEKPSDIECSVFTCKYFYDIITGKVRSLQMEDRQVLSQTDGKLGSVRNKEAKLLLRSSETNVTKVTKSVLIGRETEMERIREFLTQSISDVSQGRSKGERSLYINGVPGTGKTASVRHVFEDLKGNPNYIGKFLSVEINGMLLSDPQEAYSLLYSTIFKKHVGSMKAAQQLDYYFRERKTLNRNSKKGDGAFAVCIIAVLDELDVLLTRRQKVVYDFLEWCARENSPLIVVAIANTMDLPERVLQPRIGSRLGVNRLSFAPYTNAQLRNILDTQIPHMLPCSLDKFEPLALELCCKKVASVTGDVRRAFHVCQRALEIADQNGSELVGMTHIQEAFVEMYNRGPIISIGQLSLAEKAVYCAALLCERYYGADSIFLAKVAKHTLELTQRLTLDLELDNAKILDICYNLSFSRHITLQWSSVESFHKIFCNVQFDDFCYAVKGTVFSDVLNNWTKHQL